MKVSVALSQRLGVATLEHARTAVEVGLDGVFVFDHLIPVGDPSGPAMEAAATLGHLAASLPGRIGSMVFRSTMRSPEVTAAIARTLNAVADEVVIGLGSGDRITREETRRLGLPFPPLEERVAILAETVAAVAATGATVWVGGRHPAVLEVAVTADGWNAWEVPPEGLADQIAALDAPSDFTISWAGRIHVGEPRDQVWLSGSPSIITERISSLAAIGVSEVVVTPLPPTSLDALRSLGDVALLVR